MRRHGRCLVACLVLTLAWPSRAGAGASLELGGMGSLQETDAGVRGLLGVRFGAIRRGAPASDLGLAVLAGTMPTNWSGAATHLGEVGAIFDLGVDYGLPLSGRTLLVPRLGLTSLAAGGEGGGGVVLGGVVGLGWVVPLTHGVGWRADADMRWLPSPSEELWTLSAGLVWSGATR